jgi:hypothetical protein
MRSRQTGQVGSSEREGVGGGAGLVERGWAVDDSAGPGECDGEKGSFEISGKTAGCWRFDSISADEGEANCIDFT